MNAPTDKPVIQNTGNSHREPFKGHAPKKHKGPPSWSHQRELTSLKGQSVSLLLSGSGPEEPQGVTGTLLEADQFTVKILSDGEETVVFKHAIIAFQKAN